MMLNTKYLRRLCSSLVFTLSSMWLFSQDELMKYAALYEGCVDDQESPIYGGTYPRKWPEGLNLPEFPGGGEVMLTRFVANSMEYPDVVDSIVPGPTPESDSIIYRPKGIVYVQVVIDRCGKATRQEIIQSVNNEYDNEALRIMENLPIFRAGDYRGERVKVALIIPVYFTRNSLKKKEEEYDYGY